MAVIDINTTQNVTLNYELAGLGDRILAYIIDVLIIGAYIFGIYMLLFASVLIDSEYGWIMLPIGIIPAFFYHLVSEIFFNGQSIGKRQMKIKVVKLDGTKPSIGSYLLRWIVRPIDVGFYGIVAIMCIAIGGKGQRLGDILGGTTVIKTNKKNEFFNNPAEVVKEFEDYTPVYPEVVNLTDKDIRIMKEALKVYRDQGNSNPVNATAEKAQELLNVRTDEPPVKFLNTLIKDYNYLVNVS